jgi:outer membrane protein assembly complex protein YaeT
VFAVDAGPVVQSLQVEFVGAHALDRKTLLDAAGGPGELLTSAASARKAVAAAYRNRHYLEAQVGAPKVDASPDRTQVRIQVPVDEGRRAQLSGVRFDGTSALPEDTLREAAKLTPGELPPPEALTLAARRVREAYLERGYVDVRVRPRLAPEGSDLVAFFDVVEGEPASIGSIRITGLHRTRESLVRRQIDVRPGDPLDPRRLASIEKRLLALGVFSRAVVTAGHEEPATVNIELEENGPYNVSYDVRFSQEEHTTALVDAEAGNVAGLGLALGGRYRVGQNLNEVRLSLHLPSLGRGGDTTASGFYQAEDFKLVRENESFGVLDETEIQSGFQLQQAIHAGRRWTVLGGFSFKNIRSRARTLDHDVSGLQASLVRESRDNPLDARKGAFLSLSVQGGGKWTLSDFEYFRVFAQGFGARPISRDLTWAQGIRLGLARGLEAQRDQQVAVFGRSTELFQAGGPTSLRGYALDSVGPPGPAHGVSRGGEALLVLNEELRYLHPWGIGAAVFYDVGNVFARVQDIDFTLRHSIGAGLRYQSPIGMLRVDVGFPLNPRPTDRPVQWFFALGQAF